VVLGLSPVSVTNRFRCASINLVGVGDAGGFWFFFLFFFCEFVGLCVCGFFFFPSVCLSVCASEPLLYMCVYFSFWSLSLSTHTHSLSLSLSLSTLLYCSLCVAPDLVITQTTLETVDSKEIRVGPRLGEGSFSTVRLALWQGQRVALKILKNSATTTRESSALSEFRREVWMTGGLSHPHIVALRGVCNRPLALILVRERRVLHIVLCGYIFLAPCFFVVLSSSSLVCSSSSVFFFCFSSSSSSSSSFLSLSHFSSFFLSLFLFVLSFSFCFSRSLADVCECVWCLCFAMLCCSCVCIPLLVWFHFFSLVLLFSFLFLNRNS
jgi:Protein kinase domain